MPKLRPQPPDRQRKPSAAPDVPKAVPAVSHADLWICLALIFATFLVYAQVRHFDFVNFDDPEYVSGNPHVRGGITIDNIRWAFTSGEAANWFPVTRLSHLMDVQLFGLHSGWHHLMSVLFHALAAVLLFAFLHRATRARWPAAAAAILFAVHPLHVESVAWIAERKDVLSAFFWFLTLWAYVRYTERPGKARYAFALMVFCLGLMAKPMLVTMPFVLLLLDVWPLKRLTVNVRPAARLLWEKLPFFVLSVGASMATYLVQQSSGAVDTLGGFPLGLRIENALVTYAIYIVKLAWPNGLAVFYPYPVDFPAWQVGLALVAIVAISAVAIRCLGTRPYLAVGWFWYLGTLVPVIGLIQVGAQARADRYTYIPTVGLEIMLIWGAAEIVARYSLGRTAVTVITVVVCALFATVTWAQTEHWQNSQTLFQHALDVTEGNYIAHHNLGIALAETGKLPDAISHYEAALRIKPDSAKVHTDLGSALARVPGREADAIREYQAALQVMPGSAISHNDLGNALATLPGRLSQAIAEYHTAIQLEPGYADAHRNLGSALAKMGHLPEGVAEMEAALRLEPDSGETHTSLGRALAAMPGRMPEAMVHYQAAVRLMPDSAEAHNDLGSALAEGGRLADAIGEYQTALRLKPDYAEAHVNLGNALSEIPNRQGEALSEYQAAIRLRPESAEAHYNLGQALSKAGGHVPEAIVEFENALRLKPDYAEAHSNLGVVLSSLPGKSGEAISHFEEALRINPNYADAHYNLGVALANLPGRMPQAIGHFEAAVRIRRDPELEALIKRLRKERR